MDEFFRVFNRVILGFALGLLLQFVLGVGLEFDLQSGLGSVLHIYLRVAGSEGLHIRAVFGHFPAGGTDIVNVFLVLWASGDVLIQRDGGPAFTFGRLAPDWCNPPPNHIPGQLLTAQSHKRSVADRPIM